VLYQARDAAADQPGYYEGFERLVAEGVLSAHTAIPVYAVAEAEGWNGLWAEAERIARSIQADAVFLQFFHGAMPDPTEGILRLKNITSGTHSLHEPLGDPYGPGLSGFPQSFQVASALADVSFFHEHGRIRCCNS